MLNSSLCDKYETKPDDIAPSVQVSHYDYCKMTENNLHCIIQAKTCDMATQKMRGTM